MLAFPLLFLLSLFVFRGLIASALPLIIGGITIPVTFALIGVYDSITDSPSLRSTSPTGLGLVWR